MSIEPWPWKVFGAVTLCNIQFSFFTHLDKGVRDSATWLSLVQQWIKLWSCPNLYFTFHKICVYPFQTNPINCKGSWTFATPDLPGHWLSVIRTGHRMEGHGKSSVHKRCARIWKPHMHPQQTPVISQRFGTGAVFCACHWKEKLAREHRWKCGPKWDGCWNKWIISDWTHGKKKSKKGWFISG